MLMWGHFGIPFLFLMSRHIKRRPATLVLGSVWMLLMHYLDLYWLIMPIRHAEGVHFGLHSQTLETCQDVLLSSFMLGGTGRPRANFGQRGGVLQG